MIQRNLGIIYKHTSPSGKIYIGQTIHSINYRTRKNGKGYKNCKVFYNAIQKYGWENFKHEIIESNIPENELNNKEIYYIKEYNSLVPFGYNVSKGGKTGGGQSTSVICFSEKGEFIKRFHSMQDGADYIGKDRSCVSNAIKKGQTAGKLFWCKEVDYSDEFITNILSKYKDTKNIFSTIYTYDFNSKQLLFTFNSVKEASLVTKSHRTDISSILMHGSERGNKSVNGYIFSYEPINDFSKYSRNTNAIKYKESIYLYKDRVLIGIYDNSPDIEKASNNCLSKGVIRKFITTNKMSNKNGYILSKEKLSERDFDLICKDTRGKRIYQYSKEGVLLDSFDSLSEVALYIHGNKEKSVSALQPALQDFNKTAYDYRWSHSPNEKIIKKSPVIIKKNKNEIISFYYSITECIQNENISRTTLYRCLKDTTKTFNGFYYIRYNKEEKTNEYICNR